MDTIFMRPNKPPKTDWLKYLLFAALPLSFMFLAFMYGLMKGRDEKHKEELTTLQDSMLTQKAYDEAALMETMTASSIAQPGTEPQQAQAPTQAQERLAQEQAKQQKIEEQKCNELKQKIASFNQEVSRLDAPVINPQDSYSFLDEKRASFKSKLDDLLSTQSFLYQERNKCNSDPISEVPIEQLKIKWNQQLAAWATAHIGLNVRASAKLLGGYNDIQVLLDNQTSYKAVVKVNIELEKANGEIWYAYVKSYTLEPFEKSVKFLGDAGRGAHINKEIMSVYYPELDVCYNNYTGQFYCK